jgi:fructokinase
MPKNPFIVFGEALWDVFPDGARLGGAPLNFAYYFTRAGGAPVLVSALGQDTRGDQALEEIQRQGVSTGFIQRNQKPTGWVNVRLKAGNPRFEVIRETAWEYIEYSGGSSLVGQAQGLYVGTLARISEPNRKVMNRLLSDFRDRIKFMDLNLRQRFYERDDVEFLLKQINILKLNNREARLLKDMGLAQGKSMEQVAEYLVNHYSLKACCLTLGERGAVAADQNESLRVKAVPAEPGGDSVGAGDAFGAFWLAELLKGSSLRSATEKAAAVGSRVASQRGAVVEVGIG